MSSASPLHTAAVETGPNPRLSVLLRRGLARRCPHCGRGALFTRFVTLARHCDECDLVYEPSPGATWGFWIVGDRVFVALMLLPIYLGLAMSSMPLRVTMFVAIGAAFILSMPHRQGLCTALDYWTRIRWGADDEPLTVLEAPNSGPSTP